MDTMTIGSRSGDSIRKDEHGNTTHVNGKEVKQPDAAQDAPSDEQKPPEARPPATSRKEKGGK